jgi:hypothetical protein
LNPVYIALDGAQATKYRSLKESSMMVGDAYRRYDYELGSRAVEETEGEETPLPTFASHCDAEPG